MIDSRQKPEQKVMQKIKVFIGLNRIKVGKVGIKVNTQIRESVFQRTHYRIMRSITQPTK